MVKNSPKTLAAPAEGAGDQADGLRRMFAAAPRQQIVPVVANALADCAPAVLERLSLAFAELGAHALVVDAADSAPMPHELVDIHLGSCIERLGSQVSYLAARGLPRRYVNLRGSSESWLGELEQSAPWADVILMHASAADLSRMLGQREVCPVLMAGTESASLTDAYASMKLLSQRMKLVVFDLMVGVTHRQRRADRVAERLGTCAENFLGAMLRAHATVDLDEPLNRPVSPVLSRLAADQLMGPAGAAELAGLVHAPRAGAAVAPY